MAENIVIQELIDSRYSVRPLHDKLRTANSGRPTPPLTNFINHHKTKAEQCTRHFCIWQYGKVAWYAACEIENKLCCWYCILLLRNKYEGFLGFKSVLSAQQKHSKSHTHMHCCLQLKLFGKQQTTCFSTPNAETTSAGITNKLKRT